MAGLWSYESISGLTRFHYTVYKYVTMDTTMNKLHPGYHLYCIRVLAMHTNELDSTIYMSPTYSQL